ncbi:putative galactose oxidase/kelch, beta-propeller [Rosa chinensis]|uniref:Putative galactose oxidase/kelch, beta-propeller n=1 Tax=Rosa chinensis TaxID=74649 RepID=A0A2P6Q5R4_ROSCH|nr:uncharacterized protein LOC112201344 [Rosa chinensis]PRQ29526.1 putative galactose oxidase/kelch, beta-propeller [Rosa chinensis]
MAAPANIDDFIFQLNETKPTNIDKSTLYMCFRERMHDKSVVLVILAISLSDLLNHTEGEEGKSPCQVAYRELKRECDVLGCGVCDSQIFFVGGVGGDKMYYFDPEQPNPKMGTIRRGPQSSKIEPFVLEMNNDQRLYVLSRVPTTGSNFEVLKNPFIMEWVALPEPPYDRIGPYFCPTTDGSNIFLLGQNPHAYICHYSFSRNKWKTYSGPRSLPFTVGPPALIIQDQHSHHRILFTYEFSSRGGPDTPLFIGAYLMSPDDDANPILCLLSTLEFRRGVPSEFCGSHYQLVHCADRHIFLILYSYSPRIPDHQLSHHTDYMKICVIHLEYEFHPTRNLTNSRFLLSRRGAPHILKYSYDHGLPKKEHVCMIGAFVLLSISGDTEETGEDGFAHGDTQETQG